MYLEFYRLREFPFSNVCDERFFYESAVHAEALARMLYTVQQRRGMVLVTGEIGAGKTLLSKVLASRLGSASHTLMLKHPFDTSKQLVRSVSQSLALTSAAGSDKLALVEALEQHLLRLSGRGQIVTLIFDEVQGLNEQALEEVRLLWNMEAAGQRLVQIVLIGHPQLRDRLKDPSMAALAQRVAMAYHLSPLTGEETAAYILHRRRVAKADGCPLQFTPNALAEIYRVSKGIPRLINTVCDNALLVGYARGKHVVNSKVVRAALTDEVAFARTAMQRNSQNAVQPPPVLPGQ
jgi:general secretion pathway protein A